MAVIEAIVRVQEEMTLWRRDIHAHPELGFEENRTSHFVAEKLRGFGLEVHRGIGKTGVVGVLRTGSAGAFGRSARRHGRAADSRGEYFRAPLDERWAHARLRA